MDMKKLSLPAKRPGPKTGRYYGAVLSEIRRIGRELQQFTPQDLCPPLAPAQAAQNLRNMAANGELVRVSKGTPGLKGTPATYRFP